MERASILISLPDPEVLEAQETAMKLLREFKSCQDPLTKKAVKGMVYDALGYEVELRLKCRAKKEVKNLHEIQNPNINPN